MNLILKCSKDNDLHIVLGNSGYKYKRYENIAEAMANAETGAGVLILADEYPKPSNVINEDFLQQAERKNLKLYIEYPASCPGLAIAEPRLTEWERLVISSDFFGPKLPKLSILEPHACWFLPVNTKSSLIALARVAGYDKALFGLPDENIPILFKHTRQNVLTATTKLSQFVTGRYAPIQSWKIVWERILNWLSSENVPKLKWNPVVRPAFGEHETLPSNPETSAFNRSVKWFKRNIICSCSITPALGAIEGYASRIHYTGNQDKRVWLRADCIAETAMVLAHDWNINDNPESKEQSCRILDYLWTSKDFIHDDIADPSYGLINWYEKGPVFYGDDIARVMFSTITARRLLKNTRWDASLLKCLLACLRTTGKLGFRRDRIDLKDFQEKDNDWKFFFNEEYISYSPHFQAYLWASFLWAYQMTGYERFLSRTLTAIRMTMEAYPDWRWTNGITQEIARMLLPLSILVRIRDTQQHRDWLKTITDALLENITPCGAIRERMGPIKMGLYPSPRSNDDYGKTEAALIQQNGDPAADLLYTVNYAFIGLHEAYKTTNDDVLGKAEDKLAEFLCRVQAESDKMKFLDGAWIRAFDFEKWEYWGSSADLGWGAWCVESGWTNTWIASTIAMRIMNQSLFNFDMKNELGKLLPDILKEMFPVDNSNGPI